MLAQVRVVVNGGNVTASLFRSTYAAVQFDELVPDTRVNSRDLDFRPSGHAIEPLDIVEQRAIAALLHAMRVERPRTA